MPRLRSSGILGWLVRSWRAGAIALRRVVMLQDSPERIARGCAAGVFCAFIPTLGQIILGMLLAAALRGSVIASLPWTWITNPVTMLPTLYLTYCLGAAVTPGHQTITWHRLGELLDQLQAMPLLGAIGRSATVLGSVFVPMLIGGILVGTVAAVATWWLVRRAVEGVQARRRDRTSLWRAHLAVVAPAPVNAAPPPPLNL